MLSFLKNKNVTDTLFRLSAWLLASAFPHTLNNACSPSFSYGNDPLQQVFQTSPALLDVDSEVGPGPVLDLLPVV